MFSHVTVGIADVVRAKAFYDALFRPLGLVLRNETPELVSYRAPNAELPFFTAVLPIDENEASAGNGAMTAFVAPDRTGVDAAYAGGIGHGGSCEGAPGLRPHYHANYYGAYLRDPDGNKMHVVCHEAEA